MRTLILALCLLAVPAAAQSDPTVVGKDHPNSTAKFAVYCKQNALWCNGYLQGAIATQNTTCLPAGIKGDAFVPAFQTWYAKNPQSADVRAPDSVFRFSKEQFPCRQ